MKTIEQTTPSEYARQYKVTLAECVEKTGKARSTLERWHKAKPSLFHAVVLGTAVILERIKIKK